MKKDELGKRILEIPEDGEFWNSGCGDSFYDVGKILLEKGFSMDETIDMLETLYFATASEFGS
jgi:hypothetical protein